MTKEPPDRSRARGRRVGDQCDSNTLILLVAYHHGTHRRAVEEYLFNEYPSFNELAGQIDRDI